MHRRILRARHVYLGVLMCLAQLSCSAEPTPQAQGPSDAIEAQAALALTPREYNNTVADLLGFARDGARWPARPEVAERLIPSPPPTLGVFGEQVLPQVAWPWVFPEEPGAQGFDGIAQGQDPSPYQIEELHKAALHFGAYALASPKLFTCAQWQELTELERKRDCAWQSVKRFAQRAYRRPFVAGELARLEAFWRSNMESSPLDEAVALTLAGILESPAFLYRVEHLNLTSASSEVVALNGWELAARLSYLLWDSAPDEALYAAAERGELDDVEGLARQARRMLEDDRARDALVRFHVQLLEADKVLGVSPARRAFGPRFGISPAPPLDTTGDGDWPLIVSPLRSAMRFETELFMERAIFDGEGTLTALLTSRRGYMSDESALLYGDGAKRVEGPSIIKEADVIANSLPSTRQIELYPVEFDGVQRAGLLTLPSLLSIGAYAVQPGPILRGMRVLNRLACVELGAPPAGVEAALPPDALEVMSTNRQRTEAATSAIACAGCHGLINPPGFAFEHYDALGMWRAQDNGSPVDASGQLVLGQESIDFKDGVMLSAKLAQSPRVRDCYALRWARYALGDQIELDAPGLEAITQTFREDDSIMALLLSIITSDLFRFRRTQGMP